MEPSDLGVLFMRAQRIAKALQVVFETEWIIADTEASAYLMRMCIWFHASRTTATASFPIRKFCEKFPIRKWKILREEYGPSWNEVPDEKV